MIRIILIWLCTNQIMFKVMVNTWTLKFHGVGFIGLEFLQTHNFSTLNVNVLLSDRNKRSVVVVRTDQNLLIPTYVFLIIRIYLCEI